MLVFVILLAGVVSLSAQRSGLPAGNVVMIVVTGLRMAPDDPAGERIELSIAEGASVTVTARHDGKARTKVTAPFQSRLRGAGARFFTADFSVNFDDTYEITMTFKDGTVVRIPDYRLPAGWKTHLFFHNTTGTLSPASILRTAEDGKTRLQCRVYALFPYENYHALGGLAPQ